MLYTNMDFQLIVDGGPGDYLLQNIGKYIPFYDREIEYIVLTHAHYDHYAGLANVLESFNVKNIVLPPPPCSRDPLYNLFFEKVKGSRARIINRLDLQTNTFRISISSNSDSDCVSNQVDVNNSSLITHINENGISVLNVGDLEATNEDAINKDDVDILKAGHHCSKTSTSSHLIDLVTPRAVICSYGKNSYGHPSLELIGRLRALNISIFSTFESGNIILNINRKVIYNEKGNILQKL